MKKRVFLALNILLLAALAVCLYIYDHHIGGVVMKGTTAGCFAALGLVNLAYALCINPRRVVFPLMLSVGLILAMIGDVLLGKHFILGAGFFAAGHVMYTIALYVRQKFAPLDAILSGVMFLIALALLTFTSHLTFSEPAMRYVCYAYAAIIAPMTGKAISAFLRVPTLVNGLFALGSIMFYLSDAMLLLAWFSSAGGWADAICMYTYFPGQGLIAHAVFHHVQKGTR